MGVHLKLTIWALSAALMLAALAPDFSHGLISIWIIQILAPLVIAGPIAWAVMVGRVRVFAGVGIALAGVVLHSAASAGIYRVSAGYAAFHDGVSVSVLLATFALKVIAVIVIFMLGWAIHWLAKKVRGVPSGL